MTSLKPLSFYFLFIWGLVLRLAFSANGPLSEDDWARYFWEGNLLLQGISPYAFSPESFFSDSSLGAQANAILSQVNHPDWTAIYSPLLLVFFAFSQYLTPWSSLGILFIYFICDLWLFTGLRKLWGERIAMTFWIYPVLIKEIYANLHFELIPFAFLTISVFLPTFASGLFLGIALHLKVLFLALAIPLIISKRFNKKREFLLLGLGILLGFSLPFFIYNFWFPETGFSALLKTFQFASDFEFNALGFYWLRLVLSPYAARVAGGFILLLFSWVLFLAYNKHSRQISEAIWVGGLFCFFFLAFLPVANAWYFLLVLPFALRSQSIFLHFCVWIPQSQYLTKIQLGLPSNGYYDLPTFVPVLALVALGWGFFLERARFYRVFLVY